MISRNILLGLTGKALELQVEIYRQITKDCDLKTFLSILEALNLKAWRIEKDDELTTSIQYYNHNKESNQELIDVINFYGMNWLIDADETVVLKGLMGIEKTYDYRFGRRTLKELLPEWY